jgi:DNA-binding response OmpR family regulator
MADADRATAQAVKLYFERFGFRVDCAHDHVTAVQLLQAASYDVVITDLCLSDGTRNDGLTVVSLARGLNPASRIIVLSGSGAPGTRAQARACGADAFLHKPQHLTELRRTIDELLSGVEAARRDNGLTEGPAIATNSRCAKAVMS